MADIEENIRRLGGLRPIRTPRLVPMPEEEEVAELERTLNTRLPEGYRRFLTTFGAGGFDNYVLFHPAEPLPAYLSQDNTGMIDAFYGVANLHGTYSVAWNIDTFRDRMPHVLIPIGGNGMGDQICLGISGPWRGNIYYWDASEEGLEEDYTDQGLPIPPDLKFQNVHLIANSFEEFLDQMYINEDI